MVNTKEVMYKKAHTELYEVIKKLSKQELEKIPQNFIDNLKKNLDNEYEWKYDDTKTLEEQDFLIETKALLVEMYERYLCPEDKKEFWNNYDRICLKMIEDKKSEEYNTDNIFKNKNKTIEVGASVNSEYQENLTMQNSNLLAEVKENLFIKVINFFKKLLHK